jgi:hypothetical protein
MTSSPPELSVLLCLKACGPAQLQERLRRLDALLEGRVDYELVLVGYGDPEGMARAFRDLAQISARCRPLLHTRPSSATDAFIAGVGFARAPWIVQLDESGTDPTEGEVGRTLWSLAMRPDAALDCVFIGPRDPVLFARDVFLGLPTMPHMHKLIPEVFEYAGRACWEATLTGQVGPPWSSAQRRMRRLVVAVWRTLRGTLDRAPRRGVS